MRPLSSKSRQANSVQAGKRRYAVKKARKKELHRKLDDLRLRVANRTELQLCGIFPARVGCALVCRCIGAVSGQDYFAHWSPLPGSCEMTAAMRQCPQIFINP